MTPDQLAAIEARLRGRQAEDAQVRADDDYWPDSETIAIFNMHAPADIAALIAEVRRLLEALKQACTCVTCNGAGEIDVVTSYKDNGPNDPIEVYELDECPECDGSKIGAHVEESTARVLESCR